MVSPMQLTELDPDYQRAILKELEVGEKLIWYTQPDPDAILMSLLPANLTWLSGLFLISVGLMLHAPGDTDQLLHGLIFILIIVAVVGATEIVFVPRRASRTIYVLTNLRAFSICVTRKMNIEFESGDDRRTLKEDHSSVLMFYFLNLPLVVLLFLTTIDIFRALSQHFDLFLAAGFALILSGLIWPWFSELKFPLPKYREAPRELYSVQDMFITDQGLPRNSIKAVKLRRLGKELFNICLVSSDLGCLRFRAVRGEKATALAQELTLALEDKSS